MFSCDIVRRVSPTPFRREANVLTMSDYAVKNLDDIDDGTGDYEGVDGRFARKFLGSDHLGVSRFRYAPGFRSPAGHRHGSQEEAYVVVSGGGRIKVDDEIIDLKQWDVVRVAPQVVRGFEAGPDGLELICIGSDRPEDGDGEMIKDWWPQD
jgi:mannose-6-phosphate isomerase-like protein (cupin superfamily)